ncbi:MAG: extensin family protein [Roseivivax sp.]|nr:extensin family protein [Roseivivax sp.]
MKAALTAALLVLAMAVPALARAPERSLLPVARGQSAAVVTPVGLGAVRPVLRPAMPAAKAGVQPQPAPKAAAPQPQVAEIIPPAAPSEETVTSAAYGLSRSLLPRMRPKAMVQQAAVRQKLRVRGAVCGDPDIQGATIGSVPGRISGCGIEDAVQIKSISGIPLSQQATMDCTTAKALKSWIDKGMKRTIGSYGGGVARINVAAHYSCRTRNNQKGAKISEHGRGRAIDISGFTLANGKTITVLEDWNARKVGTMLREMHSRACGPFGTVLGPAADRFHQDHFHFDTARYRSGSYCQ